jgi:hypothetical protein
VQLVANAIHQVGNKYGIEMAHGAMAFCTISLVSPPCEDDGAVALAEHIAYLKKLFATLKTRVDFKIGTKDG